MALVPEHDKCAGYFNVKLLFSECKSYNITGALEVAVAPREGWRITRTEHTSGAGFDPPPPAVFAQGAMTSE